MIELKTKVKIPFLWGKSYFTKNLYAQVNLIVGPNGSGKTILANELAKQFEQAGYKVQFIKSDRINENLNISIIRNDTYIRTKIENVLSNMFGKAIRFEKKENNNFVPYVVNKERNIEYDLQEGECHGLKEIIALLIALYSSDSGCIFFDEPELHLHPQFQLYFMNEIRKVSADNKDKVFFLITHSPFFIELKFPEDLMGVIVCHINHIPTHIDSLSAKDTTLFRRFLPRFNTYHKQFFFSDNQIFVEGYTDQQMFSTLLSYIDIESGCIGTGIIDVGGKDELGVFFKVCSLLGTDGRIITDLDALFRGKLREVLLADPRPDIWLTKQNEKQQPFYKELFPMELYKTDKISVSLEQLIYRLEKYILDIGEEITSDSFIKGKIHNEQISIFFEKVNFLFSNYEKVEELDTYKAVILQGIILYGDELGNYLPLPLSYTIPYIKNLVSLIFAAAESARVYILAHGCIEHYYTQSKVEFMPISGKDKLFHTEREHMLHSDFYTIRTEYKDLISILERAVAKN